jgi:hypothetical protein
MNKAIVFLIVLAAAVAAGWRWFDKAAFHLGTPEILGGVVRVEDPAGGKIYYLTSQWEQRTMRFGRRTTTTKTISWVYTDLWEIDGATALPVSRKRIKKEKVNADKQALGMEQGILWARIPELAGIRLSDGEIIANKAKIEAKNPELAGLVPSPSQAGTFLPESMQPLKFDPKAGMIVRLDDARQVRIDPLTLQAETYVPKDDDAPAGAAVKVTKMANGIDWYSFVRGIQIESEGGKKEWIGLLSESEMSTYGTNRGLSHQMDFTTPRRHRLYRATMSEKEGDFGKLMDYDPAVMLPEGPDFLMAGLLTTESGPGAKGTALRLRDPDSLLVLSRDRLGDEGRLLLTRVSIRDGAAVWSSPLSLAAMSAWFPGERHAVMFGHDPSAKKSPMADDNDNKVMQVVSVDLNTGVVKSFNPDLHRNFPATEKEP